MGSARDVKEAPASDWQQQVAGVWKQVLRAEHVGLDDNFFDIGGTSLLLVSVHSRLQVLLDRKIPIADLFAYTTVRTLSERLGGAASAVSSGNVAAQSLAQKQRAAFAKARAAKKATA
ncbi:phosphopantetheine-binding protein [Acidicapsa dinghuensis]